MLFSFLINNPLFHAYSSTEILNKVCVNVIIIESHICSTCHLIPSSLTTVTTIYHITMTTITQCRLHNQYCILTHFVSTLHP